MGMLHYQKPSLSEVWIFFATHFGRRRTILPLHHLFGYNEFGNSNAMELEGAKRCFLFLQSVGLSVITFVSDRHRGIAKWLKTSQPQTTHYFDIWHVARSINKKLLKASQEKGCEVIKDWMRCQKPSVLVCDFHS